MFKDEPSFWSHSNNNHRAIMEFTSQFTDVYKELPNLDFELLGDATRRNTELLGDFQEQKMRLTKLFALRKITKHSLKTRSKLEQERIKRKVKERNQVKKVNATARQNALKVLNNDAVTLNYIARGEAAL